MQEPNDEQSKDNLRTVGCSIQKLVRNEGHLDAIRQVVLSTHKATILASELVNVHIRRMLETDPESDLEGCFNANWLMQVYYSVTTTAGAKTRRIPKIDASLEETLRTHMPPFSPPPRFCNVPASDPSAEASLRTGTTVQCLKYEARNMAAVASNNVWMHFGKRLHKYVRVVRSLDEEAYKLLTKEQRAKRKLELKQMACDIGRMPGEAHQSPTEFHEWVDVERKRLHIDAAVEQWNGQPLLYHLKARPHRFLKCMRLMSQRVERAGAKAFALYPLRRTNVPRHVRFDEKALRSILGLGQNEHDRQQRQCKKRKAGELASTGRTRRSNEDMQHEKHELFATLVDLKNAGVARRHLFDYAFTTDGVGARVQMRTRGAPNSNKSTRDQASKPRRPSATRSQPTTMPKRGIWAIDQLKHATRVDEVHAIGVDPGKRELVVCVDMNRTEERANTVRYTQMQRIDETGSRIFTKKAHERKPEHVRQIEEGLAGCNSRTATAAGFKEYCEKRHAGLEACLHFYSRLQHRIWRRRRCINAQKSEEKLYKRIETFRQHDKRPLVLAYGSWGQVAGRPGAACNKRLPPTIGVGLMRKLARRFVVAITPEAYTSKTCCVCLGGCGPWKELEATRGQKIRGLRCCTQQGCMIPLNRDRNGAINIGINFLRQMTDAPLLRPMTDHDLAHRQTKAGLCLECA